MSNMEDLATRARLLVVSADHSSDWLHALPLSACGLRMDDETLRISVGIRLGAKLCEPHTCICGAQVDFLGLHGLACKKSAGRTSQHNYINDIIWRALCRAGVPSIKEPSGLTHSDAKKARRSYTDSLGLRKVCNMGRYSHRYSGCKQPSAFCTCCWCLSREGGREEDSEVH